MSVGAAVGTVTSSSSVARMALLGPSTALSARPSRVLVVGASGAGKSTIARRISDLVEVPYVELDALFHGPSWTPRPSFVADVERFAAEPGWVTEWQYQPVRTLLADRADLAVWLDLRRAAVMRQVILRTARRRVQRERLWNDNVEPPLWRMLSEPEHIVRWAWRTQPKTAARVAELAALRPDLPIVRLRRRKDVRRWLDGPLATAVRQQRNSRPGSSSF